MYPICDYYPFGMLMPNRHTGNSKYRYGFNGMEKDDEVRNTKGASYDFGARMLDPRIGRWLSVDALEKEYPFYSTYSFVANSPIIAIDPNGDEIEIVTSTVNGKKTITVTLTGFISFDHLSTNKSKKKRAKYVDKLNKDISKMYTKNFKNIAVIFKSELKQKKAKDIIKDTDHVVYLRNLHMGKGKLIDRDGVKGFVKGIGGKKAYFAASPFNDYALHEVGHWLGLYHPNSYTKIVPGLLDLFSPGNVMHHPGDLISNGQINEFEEIQAELMLLLYDANLLNKGGNKHVQDLNKELKTGDFNIEAHSKSNTLLGKKAYLKQQQNEKKSPSKPSTTKKAKTKESD